MGIFSKIFHGNKLKLDDTKNAALNGEIIQQEKNEEDKNEASSVQNAELSPFLIDEQNTDTK